MRQTVSEANKYLRPTLKTVENGGRTTIGNDQPGAMHTIEVTSMDPEESVVPSGSGLSAGATLPTRHEINKRTIFGKFPVATQAEFDALSDAMKDKAVILTVDECPIGSEVKAIECNSGGVPVDAHLSWDRMDGKELAEQLSTPPATRSRPCRWWRRRCDSRSMG